MGISSGFNPVEAKALLAIIANLKGPTLPLPPLPAQWELVFDSPEIGAFANKWRLLSGN
jgi:hypothetical protein